MSYQQTLYDGRPAFRKYGAPGNRYRAEAEGLAALADTGTVFTPAVLHVDDTEIVTTYIDSGPPADDAWHRLGEQLAALQAIKQPAFGFSADNFCGDTPQPNPEMQDGHSFFARHRLGYQGRLAREAGLLGPEELADLERLCERLPDLVPEQGPSLLHGDLWNGNVLFDSSGSPVLIDPACYRGWPEAEIAMCALFGGFPEAFYRSWEEAAEPEPGWRERLPIYQLYHLLNHLNLFGMGYHGQVMAVIRRFL